MQQSFDAESDGTGPKPPVEVMIFRVFVFENYS